MAKTNIGRTVRQNRYNILFIAFLLTFSVLYNYPGILKSRPYSMHQWRQCDCLSITQNYYEEDRSFFEPAIYWLGDGKDGRTVSECPLIYFGVSRLWRLFGWHEYIFRLVNILIVFTGLFCLFRMVTDILKDGFWSLFTVLLLFASPLLVYYTNNFMADAPAFGIALIALFTFREGFNKRNKTLFLLSFLLFTLAGLIKISSLISFCAVLIIHAISIFKQKKEHWWFYSPASLLPYLFTLIVIAAWYMHAISYNNSNVRDIFLTGLYPIWDLDKSQIKEIWGNLTNDLLPAYFNRKALVVILLLFASLFVFFRKANRLLVGFTSLLFTGVIAYILLFYKAFTVHDYYLTNLLIFLPFPVISFLEMMKRNHDAVLKNRWVRSVAVVVLMLLVYETSVINRMKYSMSDKLVKTNIVTGKEKQELWKWYHWDYANHFKAYETVTPYLREIGITRDDRVLSLPDQSINISLYLMNQKGFTGFGYSDLPFEEKMEIYKRNGVEYLVADTSFLNNQSYLEPYIGEKVGEYMNLDIFRLR